MSYAVTPYLIPEILIPNYMIGGITDEYMEIKLGRLEKFFSQIDQLFESKNAIKAADAAHEIVKGKITRSDSASGAVYWYAFEKIIHIKDQALLLDNNDFSPISVSALLTLFEKYNVYSPESGKRLDIPFCQPDDFPLVALIPHHQAIKLREDFSELNLPETCHQQFIKWLNKAVEEASSLLLYCY